MLHLLAVYFSLSEKTIQSTFELKQRRSVLEMYTREIDCQELERWRSRWESE